MTRPVDPRIDAGRGDAEPSGPGVDAEAFRGALAMWASGVTVAAVRDAGRVYATTATAFASIALEPPLVLVSLGAGAQVLPFLEPGAAFAVSLLAEDQRRVATVFADSFPVGPSPFPDEGPPLLPGSLAGLACRVRDLHAAGDHRLVVALVEDATVPQGGASGPLLYWNRAYRALGERESRGRS